MFNLFDIVLNSFIYVLSTPLFITLAFIFGISLLIQSLWGFK